MSDEQPSLRRTSLEILALSFVVLFQELALIRWLPAQIRVLAYFPNVILVSAFLGLGVGALRARGRCLAPWWPVGVGLVVAFGLVLRRIAFTHDTPSEALFLLYADLGSDAPTVHGIRAPIVLGYLLSALSFVPLGQALANRLEAFRQIGRPLVGYAWDLGGSLLGTCAFAGMSFVGLFPWTWFAVVLAVGSVLYLRNRRLLLAHGLVASALVAAVAATERADVYSPYQALRVERHLEESTMARVLANGSLHQIALDLRRTAQLPSEWERDVRLGYHEPYRLMQGPIRNALVLGAGTGNDVATLLDEGAQHVDAVEIDREILELGMRYHPAQPYASPRVTIHVTDARSFLNDTSGRYDLIVFGTLDSMTRLSALSSVRLDNFVYTADAMVAARSRLTDDGGVVLFFMASHDFIRRHLFDMLTLAFGERPTCKVEYHGLFNTMFVAGPRFARDTSPSTAEELAAIADCPTDDWPYLYLARKGVTGFYLSVVALLLGVSSILVLAAAPELRRGVARGAADVEMMLFGMGFMLLETKLVTSMNLAWGATWLTSAVVIGSILSTILVATLASHVRPLPQAWAAWGLSAALLVTWAMPPASLVGHAVPIRLLLSVLFVGAPVAFASICFASRFRCRDAADVAFGWNVVGAVVGGLLEFGSMALGLGAMHLVALAIYLLIFLGWARRSAATGPPAPDGGLATPFLQS